MDKMSGTGQSLVDLAKRYDLSNMAAVIERTPVQIETALNESIPAAPGGPFNQVFVAGMGGSALPVDVIVDGFSDKLRVPVRAVRHYGLPSTADERSLVVVSSFSGNTEETLSALEQAGRYAGNVAVISAGGRLATIARERKYPFFRIPKELETEGFQPRSATGYFVTLLTRLFFSAGVIENPIDELAAVPQVLRDSGIRSEAEKAAGWLRDKIPVVYTDETHLMSVARIAKIKFNENSKRPAFFNAFPESNHNEMIGFSKPLANFGLLYLHDPDSHPRILSRYSAMKDVFERKQFKHVDFRKWEMPGKTKIQKIMAALMYADWCSYSLALMDGNDPTPVELVESFKQEMESISR
jgi:glucose/mannose-6-phosphate isomerase